jgi:hypothetical protein
MDPRGVKVVEQIFARDAKRRETQTPVLSDSLQTLRHIVHPTNRDVVVVTENTAATSMIATPHTPSPTYSDDHSDDHNEEENDKEDEDDDDHVPWRTNKPDDPDEYVPSSYTDNEEIEYVQTTSRPTTYPSAAFNRWKYVLRQVRIKLKTADPQIIDIQQALGADWAEDVRRHANDTLSRLRFYQFLTQCVFDVYKQPAHNLLYFLHCLDEVHLLARNSSSTSVCFTANLRPHPLPDDAPGPAKHSPGRRRKPVISDKTLAWKKSQLVFLRQGVRVFGKMTIEYKDSTKYREIEPRLYETVINNLVIRRQTPHLMLMLGHIFVPDLTVIRPDDEIPTSLSANDILYTAKTMQQREIDDHGLKYRGAHVLVTECGIGMSFGDYLNQFDKNSALARDELYRLLFQIFYTLTAMSFAKLTHYDLHTQNIFLERVAHTHYKKLIYFLTPIYYIVLPLGGYMVKLYDWDLAYHADAITPQEAAARTDWVCEHTGLCNSHNSAYDMYKVLSQLMYFYPTKMPKEILEFCRQQFNTTEESRNSTDANQNLLLRATVCGTKFSRDQCRLDSLCEIDNATQRCAGEWTPRAGSLYTALYVMRNFVNQMRSPTRFETAMLPNFDLDYLPHTYNWINCVFGLRADVLEQAKANILAMVADNTIEPLKF